MDQDRPPCSVSALIEGFLVLDDCADIFPISVAILTPLLGIDAADAKSVNDLKWRNHLAPIDVVRERQQF